MAASLSGLSASVTRILYLTGFSKELKTKDIQQAFAEYESMNGGFKIKWRDDTSLMIVFQDAAVAKRAYLHTLAFPPATLTSPNGASATIRPYDGPDAQAIIQTVNARTQHNPTHSRSHNARAASISVFPSSRSVSGPSIIHTSNSYRGNHSSNGQPQHQHLLIPEHTSASPSGREPSPILPSIPSHPTLNSLISSSLGDSVTPSTSSTPPDPAILAASMHSELSGSIGGPRIGDPGKRMLGAALGVRHPSLGARILNGSNSNGSGSQGNNLDHSMLDVQRAMGGLVVAE
ncbi:hypothetical protein AMATHDRAFT_140380 [Amanita thiersii Skay4041]|uniref:RRM domain-containing protein n=1 Tax=Amanita thiersii Skay4041 TaxID=703135 RepID=A0A2A9NX67_9AGAR|nr:hypothetical protein AMATHDRAFT_140380 [Amanita thiersii Skay4041]